MPLQRAMEAAARSVNGDVPRHELQSCAQYATDRQREVRELLDVVERYQKLTSSLRPDSNTAKGDRKKSSASTADGVLARALTNLLNSDGETGPSEFPREYHDLVVRLYASILKWFDLECALIIRDAELALRIEHLFITRPDGTHWKDSYSPGVFSIRVRWPDVEAIGTFYARLQSEAVEKEPPLLAGSLLHPHRVFLERVLDQSDLASEKDTIIKAIERGCDDAYDVLYWNHTLYFYEAHEAGDAIFARVCREALRRSRLDGRLYGRLRETSFPGNSECIWPRKKMSRFDPRVLELSDRARARSPVQEMNRIEEMIHAMVRSGRLRGGGIAEYTKGRPHGMSDFLDYGVGGCEAFSSFITTPLLSLGNDRVYPVFVSRPYQPWGHWIAGLGVGNTYYVCDGENAKFGPARTLPAMMQHLLQDPTAAMNRFVSVRFYAQTLASWEWEFMIVVDGPGRRPRRLDNKVLAAYLSSRGGLNRPARHR
jgi:hypothetical protein